ncbi:uncharacterized protein H6S33_011057 [Morchella sextelata]|uniref:uncharacterized protein n=1 Tax=Morchella sextelata TaxID=1174677 RepID=UPI001D04E661|nr:uncharacterized protein H6S33_011057 [Morchella sextelata]KAH0611792.1 hypothetical protein H6S33_011057 [Morchella sextelata]
MRFRILLLILSAAYSLLTYRPSVVVAGPMRATVSNLTNLAEAMAYHRDAYLLCLSLMSEHNTAERSKASPTAIYHPRVTAGVSSIRLHLTNTRLNRPPTRITIALGSAPTALNSPPCTSPAEHERSTVTLNHRFPAPTKSYAESICSDEEAARQTSRPPLFPYLDILTTEEEDDIIRAVRSKHETETKRFLMQLWLFIGGLFVWWWALLGW